MNNPNSDIQAGYDCVAEQYANEFFEELKRKPFDCEMLDAFAESIRDKGVVYEFGCGPGQVARYLRDRGVDMCGVDLSAEMVRVARRLNPDIPFDRGDMQDLNVAADSLAGIVLFYSIIHIERKNVTRALHSMNRALFAGGELFMAFHGGEGQVHRDEWYGQLVSIDFILFQEDEMAGYLEAAGFDDIRIVQREPYDFEYPTRRFYLSAKKRG